MITKETVEHVARVSRITLTDEEVDRMAKELSEVLDSFSLIRELETDKIRPSFHPIEIKNIVRDDVPETSLSQDEALSNTELKEGKFFKGPRSV
jgi:aspartyl-tRNA(Asn)/glutamyl-tRNA(Gln) amidotransferase subunit C